MDRLIRIAKIIGIITALAPFWFGVVGLVHCSDDIQFIRETVTRNAVEIHEKKMDYLWKDYKKRSGYGTPNE